MKRIALVIVVGLLLLAFAFQLVLINSKEAHFIEPQIISLALTSEFILLIVAIILLRLRYLDKKKLMAAQQLKQWCSLPETKIVERMEE